MSSHTEILTDLESNVWLPEYRLDPGSGLQLGGATEWSIHKRTLRGGPSEGIDVVTVNNGGFSFDVLPTRGMGLWRGNYRGTPVGWNSPTRYPVHPSLVQLTDLQGLGWLTGFNEWICRCGLSSLGSPGLDVAENEDGSRRETPVTLHGRIANTPCHHVSIGVEDDGPGTLWVRGVMDEAWLFGPKLRLTSTVQTTAGSNAIEIQDEVTNFGNEAGEMQLMYHINLGRPFLEQGSRLVVAASEIAANNSHSASAIKRWAEYDAPLQGFIEQCFFFEPLADEENKVSVMLCNSARDKGFGLSFRKAELPCFTLWKNTAGEADGYVTGLEPGTSYPNLKSFERDQGRVVALSPGESYTAWHRIEIYDGTAPVSEAAEAIRQQVTNKPVIHRELNSRYSPIS